MIIDVQREWRLYCDACFGGRTINTVQYDEMRRAFLSGMWRCYHIIVELSAQGDEARALDDMTRLREQTKSELDVMLIELIKKTTAEAQRGGSKG